MSERRSEELKKTQACKKSSMERDEFAAYAFDMLRSLRDACKEDQHHFLSYLIGMAAEEAQRLSEGLPSTAAQFGKRPQSGSTAKKH
ncbi:MAG: hypothetical protein HEP70_15680 [Rhodobiaceae bacterium]|nr:hypothetical protein [Rhodobiaceae bacterium]